MTDNEQRLRKLLAYLQRMLSRYRWELARLTADHRSVAELKRRIYGQWSEI